MIIRTPFNIILKIMGILWLLTILIFSPLKIRAQADVDTVAPANKNSGLYNYEENNWKDKALNKKAHELYKKEKYNEALIFINDAIAINPKSSYNYSLKAYIYVKLKQFENAIQTINKAIALNNSKDDFFELKGNETKHMTFTDNRK